MLKFLAKGFIILLILCFFGLSALCGAIKPDDLREIVRDRTKDLTFPKSFAMVSVKAQPKESTSNSILTASLFFAPRMPIHSVSAYIAIKQTNQPALFSLEKPVSR